MMNDLDIQNLDKINKDLQMIASVNSIGSNAGRGMVNNEVVGSINSINSNPEKTDKANGEKVLIKDTNKEQI